jgi:hypothetical protein
MSEKSILFSKNTNRRSFLKTGSVAAGAATVGTGFLAKGLPAFGQGTGDSLTGGDIAILRLLAAAELIESDLWQQYSELGGIQDAKVSGVNGGNAPYQAALRVLDGDMNQYIHDNTEDEISHAAFLNAYLASKGAPTVNLDQFRTLPSSQADGARQIGRLTNLTQLTIDTSFWSRYRSTTNIDVDSSVKFARAVPSLNVGRHTATSKPSPTPPRSILSSSSRAARASTPPSRRR